jgi:putative membrane protein
MNRRDAFLALALLAGGAAVLTRNPAIAQGMDQTGGTTRFVRVAAVVSDFEIEAGRLVLQRSSNVAVRGFAQRMVDDHAQLLHNLKFTNDSNANAPLPRGLSREGRQMMEELRNATGPSLDVLYMDMQVRNLSDALAVFREYSRVGSVESLRRYSVRYTPMLEDHVRDAQTVRGSLAA